MKRVRDDAYYVRDAGSGPSSTVAVRSDGEVLPSEQNIMASGNDNQKLSTKHALVYLRNVKDVFHDNKEKYGEFLEVMKDFKAERTDTRGVIERVRALFKDHPDLILGFNDFLPHGYSIQSIAANPVDLEDKKPIEFEEAISFVNKIKARFRNNDRVYKSFLDVLNMYRTQSKSIEEVYHEVSVLFQSHQDLLDEFVHFLPDTSTLSSTFHSSSGRLFGHQDNRSSAKPAIFNGHVNKKGDETFNYREHDKKKKVDRENDRMEDHYMDDKELEQNCREFSNMKRKRKILHRADAENVDQEFKGLYAQEFGFCEKVKSKLHTNTYQEFLKCLHIYSTEIIDRIELKKLVSHIFGKYPDLMDGFNDFLARCENIDGFLADVFDEKNFPMSVQVEDKDNERERERDRDGVRQKEKEMMEKYPHFVSKDTSGHRSYITKDKYNLFKPISELDLSNSEQCTPSYRRLPKKHHIPPSRYRTDIDAAVLNDNWVSVTSGSEDYSFNHMRKNQYEESLFRCEDDRFEIDMLLKGIDVTISRVEELMIKMEANIVKPEKSLCLEDHFTSLNMRCIERLYGEHGLDTIDILRKNAACLTLPVILSRLKQKQEEWFKCRDEFNKLWAGIYAKNYQKSLDHRSFYFKQRDIKNLGTKALVADIKDINERKRREDDVLYAIAAGNQRPIIPNMEFEFANSDVHEDLYKIIKYSCGEVFASLDLVGRVMRIWTTLLEPMLGISPRPHDTIEYSVKAKKHREKCTIAFPAEGDGSLGADCVTGHIKKPHHVCNGIENISLEENVSYNARLVKSDFIDKKIFHNGNQTSCQNNNVFDTSVHGKVQNIVDIAHAGICNKIGDGSVRSEVEREEGELTPNGDFEEDNFLGFEESARNEIDAFKPNEGSASRTYPVRINCEVVEGENDIDDEGDESGQSNTEDSENASAAVEDVSPSESHDGEDSREDNEEDVNNDDKAESEREAERISVNNDAEEEEGTSLSILENFLHTAKPLAKYVQPSLYDMQDKSSRIFYGNFSLYVLFRLHQILYARILSAKENSASTERKWKTVKGSSPPNLYAKFLSSLYRLLDGSSDDIQFEDECREIVGTQSYVLFTIDKLIYKVVKQLEVVARDEMANKLLELHAYEKSRRPESYIELVYHENARLILQDESLYRFEFKSDPSQMSIQLMDSGYEKAIVTSVPMDPSFDEYLNNDFLSITNENAVQGVLLRRIIRKILSTGQYSSPFKCMEGTYTLNRLECRISCISSKVTYVLGTEDVFYRRRRRHRVADTSNSRQKKFHCFQSKHTVNMTT